MGTFPGGAASVNEEIAMKDDKKPVSPAPNPAIDILSGGNIRREVAGCPTGMSGMLPRRTPPKEEPEAPVEPGEGKEPRRSEGQE